MRSATRSSRLIILLAAAVVTFAACSQDTMESAEVVDAALDERALTAVFEGTVVDTIGGNRYLVKVDDVIWLRSRLATTVGTDLTLVPIAVGDVIEVSVHDSITDVPWETRSYSSQARPSGPNLHGRRTLSMSLSQWPKSVTSNRNCQYCSDLMRLDRTICGPLWRSCSRRQLLGARQSSWDSRRRRRDRD